MMNEKKMPHIIMAVLFVVFIVLGLACGTTPDSSEGQSRSQPALRNASAYWERARSNYQNGNYELAIEDYTEVIRLSPNYAPAYNSRAWANEYHLRRNFDDAIADANQALRLSPNDASYLDTRGWAYLGNGDYDKAIADFKAALQINPNIQESVEGLALAQRREPLVATATQQSGGVTQIQAQSSRQYLLEGVPIRNTMQGSQDTWDEYIFKPAENGIIIFKSNGPSGYNHYMEIVDYQNRQPLSSRRTSGDSHTIILSVSPEKEYLFRIRLLTNGEYNISANIPRTYNASEADFSFTLASDNVSVVITRYTGPRDAGTLIIPATIQGLPVSEIARFAFSNESHFNRRTDSYFSGTVYNNEIINVVIPEGVKTIGAGAFFMNRMFTVNIPNSVTAIGNSAFDGCSNIKEITLPNGVTNYGQMIFQGTGLENITFPANMRTIPRGMLSGTQISNFIIPEGITEIGDNAFTNCRLLTSITLPSSLRNIGNSAFSGCAALTEVSIPRGVTTIGSAAFSGCTRLTSIVIPEGITTINERTFSSCTGLQSASLPSTIRTINAEAFANCRELKEINIPDNVSGITWGGRYFPSSSSFDSGTDTRPFKGIVLPLAVQAKLRQLGYEFRFDA